MFPDTTLTTRTGSVHALTLDQVRDLTREHVEFLAALFDSAPHYPMNDEEISLVANRVLAGKPEFATSIFATARKTSGETSTAAPFEQVREAAVEIIHDTQEYHGETTVWAIMRGEIMPYSFYLNGWRH